MKKLSIYSGIVILIFSLVFPGPYFGDVSAENEVNTGDTATVETGNSMTDIEKDETQSELESGSGDINETINTGNDTSQQDTDNKNIDNREIIDNGDNINSDSKSDTNENGTTEQNNIQQDVNNIDDENLNSFDDILQELKSYINKSLAKSPASPLNPCNSDEVYYSIFLDEDSYLRNQIEAYTEQYPPLFSGCVKLGSKIKRPTDPIKDGWYFLGYHYFSQGADMPNVKEPYDKFFNFDNLFDFDLRVDSRIVGNGKTLTLIGNWSPSDKTTLNNEVRYNTDLGQITLKNENRTLIMKNDDITYIDDDRDPAYEDLKNYTARFQRGNNYAFHPGNKNRGVESYGVKTGSLIGSESYFFHGKWDGYGEDGYLVGKYGNGVFYYSSLFEVDDSAYPGDPGCDDEDNSKCGKGGEYITRMPPKLWGGSGDNEDNLRGLTSTNPISRRQGPCEDGWHISSVGEWLEMINIRSETYNHNLQLEEKTSGRSYEGSSIEKLDLFLYNNFSERRKRTLGHLNTFGEMIGSRADAPSGSHFRWLSTATCDEFRIKYGGYCEPQYRGTSIHPSLYQPFKPSISIGYGNHRMTGKSIRCFKDNPNKKTIVFVTKGGTKIDNREQNIGTTVQKPDAPSLNGYYFGGWYTDEKMTKEYDFKSNITGDLILYAKRQDEPIPEDPTPTTYTVTFDSNGGSPTPAPQTIEKGKTATKPSNPTRNGYTFQGRYSNSSLTTAYNFSSPVTKNITLYAKWETNSEGGGGGGGGSTTTNTYTVTFESNGGTSVSSKRVQDGDYIYEPSDPTMKGYTFDGWFTKSNGGSQIIFPQIINKNTTYYAQWIENSYTIKYNLNGGNGSISNDTVDYSERIRLPSSPTRDGYTFDGWNTRSNGRGTSYRGGEYVSKLADRDGDVVTLYAQRKENSDSTNDSNTSSSNISISLYNSTNPVIDEWIGLIIKTDTKYTGIINFGKLQYYSYDTSNRINLPFNTKSYISDYDDYIENGYRMTSNDYGYKIIQKLIKFKKEGNYKLYVSDKNGNETSLQFYVKSGETKQNNTSGYDLLPVDIISGNIQNLLDTSDEVYIARSCKQYKIQYNAQLGVFTSPNLNKNEYFVNKEYFKRYIDSKNKWKQGCPTNGPRISTSYIEKSTDTNKYIAPNGKVYFISIQNGLYISNELNSKTQTFGSLSAIKYFIRDRNPLIGM